MTPVLCVVAHQAGKHDQITSQYPEVSGLEPFMGDRDEVLTGICKQRVL